MKKIGIVLLVTLSLLASAVLPIAATPNDPLIAATRTKLEQTLGIDTPGAALVLDRGGETLLLEGYGYADINSRVLVHPETVFELGELSSLFVVLAAYRLAENGAVSLDANIADYLPDPMEKKLGLAHVTTLRQLLLGCGGFEGRTFDLIFDTPTGRFDTLEQALLAEVPRQIAAPGTFYAYSEFGIALAAYVVECIAGVPYDEYVTAEILTPLGMEHTVLDPDENAAGTYDASGHVFLGEGRFAVEKEQGRSYAGLYPATGARSAAADLARLLAALNGGSGLLSSASCNEILTFAFENGIFAVSAPGMTVQGGARGISANTLSFGASLWFSPATKTAVLVMTNVQKSDLLTLPAELCGAHIGKETALGGNLTDLQVFRGVYTLADREDHSFVGLLDRKDHSFKCEVLEDGTLSFLDMTLRQVSPGVFAKADDTADVAQLQFLMDQTGKVYAVVTAAGETYLPVPFLQQKIPATLLFFLLLALAAWFLFAGIVSTVRYLAFRYEEGREPFVYTLPLLFAALVSLLALLQVWVGVQWGAMAYSSFFGAMSVITVLFTFGALACLIVAFMASLTRKGMTTRVVRTALLFIAFVLVLHFWGLSAL